MNKLFAQSADLGRKAGYSYLNRSVTGKDHTIYVSDLAWENWKKMADQHGMSRSAFIDAVGRGEIVLGDSVAEVSGDLLAEDSIAGLAKIPSE